LALTALLLTAAGRREAGLTAVPRPWWLLAGPVLGALAALGIGALGTALYGHGADHWYHSVRAAALANPGLAALSPPGQWLAFTLPAIAFSPLGEECFFRGLLELSLRERWGRRAAVAGSAVAFGAIHLLHHGVAWGAGGVTLRPVPGLLWFVLMALTGGLLSWCRARGGALWVAVAAHAGFNAAMGWVVFH
nr:CPBP family intramembrane metalloprotease [Gemmatimonadales bacterium]